VRAVQVVPLFEWEEGSGCERWWVDTIEANAFGFEEGEEELSKWRRSELALRFASAFHGGPVAAVSGSGSIEQNRQTSTTRATRCSDIWRLVL
jgi:hypothetical protein